MRYERVNKCIGESVQAVHSDASSMQWITLLNIYYQS